MPLVEIQNLFVTFGARPAVDGISLQIGRGERLGLIGESGSGKTLTALSIAGLLPDGAKTEGTIRFDGTELPQTDRAMSKLRGRRIGFIFQEPLTALNPLARASDQIAEMTSLHFPARNTANEVRRLLAETGLEAHHADRFPHQLSGGQRQRVMIAMVLAGEPDLLICDEPTSALDTISERLILELLDKVARARDTALLFISHDLRAVAALCDRIGVLQRGALVEMGTKDQILSRPQSAYTKALVTAAETIGRPPNLPTTAHPLLEVTDISRVFAPPFSFLNFGGQPVAALSDVTLKIMAADSLALVGPSGCGKTTFARIISGLDHPDSGAISFDGTLRDRGRLSKSQRREISLVFQDPHSSFDPRVPVGRSLREPLGLLPALSEPEKAARVIEMVEAVGLDPTTLDRFPHQFSGGQRQRFAIARALVTRPKLVILDEPVSALDMTLRQNILALFNDLRERYGLTYLVISHDLEMVGAIADKVAIMDEGRIVEHGTISEILRSPKTEITQRLLEASKFMTKAITEPA